MSHFLCLATPPQIAAETIAVAFGPRVFLTPATSYAIGKLTRGKYENWNAYIVKSGFDSGALIYKQADELAAALRTLLQSEDCREIHFMAHLFTGYVADEEFEVKEQRRFHLEELAEVVANLELDIRYALAKRYPWEQL